MQEKRCPICQAHDEEHNAWQKGYCAGILSERLPAPTPIVPPQHGTETPFEAYERIVGEPWPGGSSDKIKALLFFFGIPYVPASEEANISLQKRMNQLFRPTSVPPQGGSERLERQRSIGEWATAAFGREQSLSIPHRGIRHLEESAELAQSCGVDEAMAHKLVSYVWSRPAGEIAQEMGGVGVTLLALAHAAGLDVDAEELREVQRVLSKPLEHFARRNDTKNQAGFLAAPPVSESPEPI